MRFEIIFPGRTKESYLREGINDFSKRLGYYVKTSLKTVKEKKKGGNADQMKEQQGRELLARCPASAYIVALDPAGKQPTSEELAELINTWEIQGRQIVSFVIGGPDGLSAGVVEKADLLLSLSRMTFTHDMARLILLEQLYRAYTIKAGTKYHK